MDRIPERTHQELLEIGLELMRAGMPAVPSNLEMHCYHIAKQHEAELEAALEYFLDHVDEFLEGLKWELP